MSKPNKDHKGEISKAEVKKPERPSVRNQRPIGFNDMESMAKDLLNSSGINYFEWLDKLHKQVVLDEVTKNKDVIVDLLNS